MGPRLITSPDQDPLNLLLIPEKQTQVQAWEDTQWLNPNSSMASHVF